MLHDPSLHAALKRERQRALCAGDGPTTIPDLLRRVEAALAAREGDRPR